MARYSLPFLTLPFLVPLMSILLLSPGARAQKEVGTILGTVTDAKDARISTAEITLENPLSGRHMHALADDQGQFQFEGMPYGAYVCGRPRPDSSLRPNRSVFGPAKASSSLS